MKAVAFVCLLSLSLCLSQPASQPDAPTTHLNASAKTETKPTPEEHKDAASTIKTEVSIVTTSEKPPEKNEKAAKQPTPNETKPNATTPQETKTQNATKPSEAAKTNDKEKAAEVKPSNETKPTEETKTTPKANETVATTPKPVTQKPTEAPKDTTEKPIVTARGFDGPSFIGGIILTLGLLAISFMGFKYYKNQTERNYHTL